MFDFCNSPCVFEPRYVPLRYSASYCDPHINERLSRNRVSTLQYDVEENRDSYILSLHKQVPREIVSKAVESRLMEYAASYEPRYDLVTDFFGNGYYVRRSVSESELINEAMQSIDMRQLGKQLAQQAFEDYAFTLARNGYKLVVESGRDSILRAFELEKPLTSLFVDSFEMDDNCIAILKVVLVKRRQVELASIPVHIKWDYMPQFCGSEFNAQRVKQAREPDLKEEEVTNKTVQPVQHPVVIPITFKKKSESIPTQRRDDEEEHSKKKELVEEFPRPQPIVTRPLLVHEQNSSNSVETNENAIISDDEKEVPSLQPSRASSRAHSVTLENVEDEEIKRWRRSASFASQDSAIVQDN